MEKKEEKRFTFTDLIEIRDEEKLRIRTILTYLLNKNSRPLEQGGVDYATFFDDIQDLESSLHE